MARRQVNPLFLISILLAFACVIWAYAQLVAAKEAATDMASRHSTCAAMLDEIALLQKRNLSGAPVANISFDPTISVRLAARDSGIPTDNYFVTPSRLSLVEGTDIRLWKVAVPPVKITLSQACGFVRNLAELEMKFQVEAARFEAAEGVEQELWSCTLDIRFLKVSGE